jgi:hypothetical protein
MPVLMKVDCAKAPELAKTARSAKVSKEAW